MQPDEPHAPHCPRPQPIRAGELRRHFVRGRKEPRGVVWFGVTSFWGHLRHLVAAAIATEDIDSRDWMTADEPRVLLERVAVALGGSLDAEGVVEALGRDLWIDYISDTGDDVSVSAAVARLLFSSYELPDPRREGAWLTAPRGDVLLFGGDTAYPVATAQEITNRVLVPFNRVLEERDDGRRRVLLGIPGNHDWYDGLDGFGRMFRLRDENETIARPSTLEISRRMLDYYAEWAREFVRGGKVDKPSALRLAGYVPVQNASYFVLPLSAGIHLLAADRQLKTLDSRQQRFHSDWYRAHPEVATLVLLPDPLYQYGAPSRTGTQMVQALGLDFAQREHFLLSGDVHHYERSSHPGVLHVTAGGGGAFLHPAPVFEGRMRADVRWPNSRQSGALLRHVSWKVAAGRSGFLPHLLLAALFAPAMLIGVHLHERPGVVSITPFVIAVLLTTIYTFIGGVRRKLGRTLSLAAAAAVCTAAVPILAAGLLTQILASLHYEAPVGAIAGLTLVASVFVGAWCFGAYLAWLTRLGLEHTQAFTALDHPGYKHFVRLRVRADGSGVDGWCVGLVDPLKAGEEPVLVDKFEWKTSTNAPRAA